MMNDSWKGILDAVAPAIATAFGGPLAGIATKALADKLLGNPNASQADVQAAVEGLKPEDMVKLRQIDAEFKTSLISAGIKLEEIASADRASARDMTIRTGDSWTPRGLAVLVVGGWMGVQWFLLGHVIDPSMKELIARVLGTLDGALVLVLSFYFGSSSSSQQKTDIIDRATK
jgi:hypothetical protein